MTACLELSSYSWLSLAERARSGTIFQSWMLPMSLGFNPMSGQAAWLAYWISPSESITMMPSWMVLKTLSCRLRSRARRCTRMFRLTVSRSSSRPKILSSPPAFMVCKAVQRLSNGFTLPWKCVF